MGRRKPTLAQSFDEALKDAFPGWDVWCEAESAGRGRRFSAGRTRGDGSRQIITGESLEEFMALVERAERAPRSTDA